MVIMVSTFFWANVCLCQLVYSDMYEHLLLLLKAECAGAIAQLEASHTEEAGANKIAHHGFEQRGIGALQILCIQYQCSSTSIFRIFSP